MDGTFGVNAGATYDVLVADYGVHWSIEPSHRPCHLASHHLSLVDKWTGTAAESGPQVFRLICVYEASDRYDVRKYILHPSLPRIPAISSKH